MGMTDAVIRLDQVSFEYAAARGTGVRDITLEVRAGEVVVLCGSSGSGKSTLARIANGLVPQFYEGTFRGSAQVAGVDVAHADFSEVACVTGSVFQDPRTQFFTGDTTSELAFGPENLGVDPALIRQRVDAMAAGFDLTDLLGRSVLTLSGGEQQRLACAVADMTDPPVLILDEPSSTLDATAVESLTRVLQHWKQAGKAILIAEHRLDYLAGLADRFVYLADGAMAGDFSHDQFLSLGPTRWEELGLRSPTGLATTVRPVHGGNAPSGPTLDLAGIRLTRGRHTVLDIADAHLPLGTPLAVIGANGAGKSTLARWLAGLGGSGKGTMRFSSQTLPTAPADRQSSRPHSGHMIPQGPLNRRQRLDTCYLVAQNTHHQLFSDTVLGEVLLSSQASARRQPENRLDEAAARQILADLDLDHLADRHPLTLSGGEKQRLVIAVAMASRRRIVIVDEPTSGLDATHMRQVAAAIETLHHNGTCVIVITHDADLVALTCGSVIRLNDGQITESYPLDTAGLAQAYATLDPAINYPDPVVNPLVPDLTDPDRPTKGPQ